MLLGTPLVLALTATAGMSAESRRRSRAALHLMGVPRRTLATAALAEGVVAGLAGWIVGIAAAAVGAALLARTGTLGISWYSPRLGVSTATILTTLAVPLALGVLMRRATIAELDDPVRARADGPPRPRPWKLIPLAAGVALMTGVLLQPVVGAARMSGGMAFAMFAAGIALAVIGLGVGSAELIRTAAARLHRADDAPNRHLALRGLAWRAGSVARTMAGVCVVAILGLLGCGAIADLDALSTPGPHGDEWTISLTGTDLAQASAALRVEGASRVAQVRQGTTTLYVGSCEALAMLLESQKDSTAPLSSACAAPERHQGATGRFPWGGRFRIGDPASLLSTTHNAEIIAHPGTDTRHVDDYLSAVVHADPGVSVSNTSADTFKPSIVPTARLLQGCVLIGFLIAFVLVALTAIDAFEERRAAIDRLRVLGVTGSAVVTMDASALAIGAGVLTVTANVIGWLAGASYDVVGATGANPGVRGLLVSAFSVAAAAGTVLAASAVMRRSMARRPLALTRME
ncbi:hypothetical protein [Nocardioides mesophilus]|uniref:ABC transporter permease n=1 Tax=Nocardioides mesophilus TaxID=433659 RepID=A0A7G9RDS2_9ACTN|nr:hypothetical protein [Nocardioides mesophilus]QNN53747.1 hypothetical protein H9L09_04855 [Nocardioides mesophilus]